MNLLQVLSLRWRTALLPLWSNLNSDKTRTEFRGLPLLYSSELYTVKYDEGAYI